VGHKKKKKTDKNSVMGISVRLNDTFSEKSSSKSFISKQYLSRFKAIHKFEKEQKISILLSDFHNCLWHLCPSFKQETFYINAC